MTGTSLDWRQLAFEDDSTTIDVRLDSGSNAFTILDTHAGVLRDAAGLAAALAALRPLAFGDGPQADPALTALFIVWGALARTESRGGHYRTDHPAHAAEARSSARRASRPCWLYSPDRLHARPQALRANPPSS